MIAVAVMAVAGWVWVRRLDEGVLLGGVLAAAALLLLDLVGVRWSAGSLVITLILLCLPKCRTGFSPSLAFGRAEARPTLGLAAAAVLWHLVYALQPNLWDWSDFLIGRRDFFFIWGYKAHLFFAERGIPWTFLRSLPNDFSHPDYPLLVPLLFDINPVLTGHWQPATIAWLDTALGAALLGVVYRCLKDDFAPLPAALGTFALSGCALLPWVGFADGPLVAYGGAAALLIRRALRGHTESLPMAVVLLAAATMAKNEGIALAVAIAIALAMENRAILRKLWPVAVVVTAWLAARAAVPTDLFRGDVLGRVGRNLAAFPHAFATVPTYLPLVWIVALILIAINPRRERFLLTVAAIQMFFYLAAYAITPLDLAGHVNGSWTRLTSHLTIFVAFAGVSALKR